jgi:hypothetical protein
MTLETEVGSDPQFQPRQDEREFRLVYAGIFTISLVAAAFSRLFSWRRERRNEGHKSIVSEARARASRIVPFFFMG